MAHTARIAEAQRARAERVRRALNTRAPARRHDCLDRDAIADIARTLGVDVDRARELLADVLPEEPPPKRRGTP